MVNGFPRESRLDGKTSDALAGPPPAIRASLTPLPQADFRLGQARLLAKNNKRPTDTQPGEAFGTPHVRSAASSSSIVPARASASATSRKALWIAFWYVASAKSRCAWA